MWTASDSPVQPVSSFFGASGNRDKGTASGVAMEHRDRALGLPQASGSVPGWGHDSHSAEPEHAQGYREAEPWGITPGGS